MEKELLEKKTLYALDEAKNTGVTLKEFVTEYLHSETSRVVLVPMDAFFKHLEDNSSRLIETFLPPSVIAELGNEIDGFYDSVYESVQSHVVKNDEDDPTQEEELEIEKIVNSLSGEIGDAVRMVEGIIENTLASVNVPEDSHILTRTMLRSGKLAVEVATTPIH